MGDNTSKRKTTYSFAKLINTMTDNIINHNTKLFLSQ